MAKPGPVLRRQTVAFVCGSALLLAGCTSPAATPVTGATPVAEVVRPVVVAEDVVVVAEDVMVVAEDVVVVAEDAASPKASPEAGALVNGGVSVVPGDSQFHVAAYRDGEMSLHLLGDQVFVSGAGGLAQLDARGERLVNVEYGLSGQSDEGDFEGWSVISFGGSWPDNAWLTTEFALQRDGSPRQLYRREGALWKPQKTLEGVLRRAYPVIMNWYAGQVLGLRVYEPADDHAFDDGPSPKRRRRLAQARAKRKPGFDVLGPGPRPTPTSMVIAPTLEPAYAATAPTGEVFLLAHEDNSDSRKPRVQRWGLAGAEAIAGAVDVLPDGRMCEHLRVRAADEAYVGCHGEKRMHLVRFDGATWADEPVPAAEKMKALTIAPDGAIYMVVEGGTAELWRRAARGAAWEPVALPEVRFANYALPEWVYRIDAGKFLLRPAYPEVAAKSSPVVVSSVLADPKGELWVAGRVRVEWPEGAEESVAVPYPHVVLRTGTAGEALGMLADGDLFVELHDWRPAPKWSPAGCDSDFSRALAFVPLRSLPSATPRNLPEPSVERFVKEHAELLPQVERIVEVIRRGRRTVGMFVRPVDQAGADALLAALEELAPGEKRTIECRMPRIRREFDRGSGKALQAPAI